MEMHLIFPFPNVGNCLRLVYVSYLATSKVTSLSWCQNCSEAYTRNIGYKAGIFIFWGNLEWPVHQRHVFGKLEENKKEPHTDTNPNSGSNSGPGAVTTSCMMLLLDKMNTSTSLKNTLFGSTMPMYLKNNGTILSFVSLVTINFTFTIQMVAWLWNALNVNTAEPHMQHASLCFVIYNSVSKTV